jgi:hypothetical protein
MMPAFSPSDIPLWSTMILQATLWVQPYIKEGDF